VTRRRGIRCKQLLDDLKGKKGYWKLKDEEDRGKHRRDEKTRNKM
jgi:hypothetical protein